MLLADNNNATAGAVAVAVPTRFKNVRRACAAKLTALAFFEFFESFESMRASSVPPRLSRASRIVTIFLLTIRSIHRAAHQ